MNHTQYYYLSIMKQHNRAVCLSCKVLCDFSVYCTVLYCTVLYCTVLYCTVLYCTVLYCTVSSDYQCDSDPQMQNVILEPNMRKRMIRYGSMTSTKTCDSVILGVMSLGGYA